MATRDAPGSNACPAAGALGPKLRRGLASGQVAWDDDELVALDRDGCPHAAYVSDSSCPMRLDSGAVVGDLATARETTPRVIGERRLREMVSVHDGVLQTFFAIGLAASSALSELPPDRLSEPIAAALGYISELTVVGADQLRAAVAALSGQEVVGRELVVWLWRLIRAFEDRTGIEADLVVTGTSRRLPFELAETLHAVARGALASVARRSNASAVVVGRTGAHTINLVKVGSTWQVVEVK